MTPLKLDESIENRYSCFLNGEFTVLNLSKKFNKDIDWNCSKYGKLWTYNLTYFEYLREKEDVSFIYDFIDSIETVKDGLEPFPVSLRGINWIKFLVKYNIQDKKINDSLYAQYYMLLDKLEYHLLGNHLLENGFSLLFGAYYFKDEVLYAKAKEILEDELEEQVLQDGGHFELSPMYHQLMLFRLLDCINLVENNIFQKKELLDFLRQKASLMLGWLKNITFKNGNIPLFNDSSTKIAPTSKELFEYAERLDVETKLLRLNDSGYRKVTTQHYECIVDVGEVGASYIPGHAHADTFNFEVYMDDKNFIVDSGLSTYEANQTRAYERSTKAHNTVEVLKRNSSEVWGGFRVAKRASIVDLKVKENIIESTHDGYKNLDILHTRKWSFFEDKIIIEDSLSKECDAVMILHFHPNISKSLILQKIKSNGSIKFTEYFYASEFNKRVKALSIEVEFNKNLMVEISI